MRRHISTMIAFSMLFFASPCLAESGSAAIASTGEGHEAKGTAYFTDTDGGLKVTVELSGLSAGKHGFHIHQYGNCADMGKAAGGHYNPDGVMHGLLVKDGFQHAHAGDLGNVEIGADGTGHLGIVIPNLTLAGGKYSVGGRSLVIHELPDDFGQPVGNAGARVACGPIMISGEKQS